VTKEGDRGIYIISTPTLFLAFEPFKCLYWGTEGVWI
jgi:hypothetical protein